MAENTEAATRERPENEASKFERECMTLLAEADGLARFQPNAARDKTVEVQERLNIAAQHGWPGVKTIHAMLALLEANLLTFTSDRSAESIERLHEAYLTAIDAAEAIAHDSLYYYRALRAYAGMLVHHNRLHVAQSYLCRIIPVEDSKSKKMVEARKKDEDLWLQATLQLAEVEWLLGNPDKALSLLDGIDYPEDYVHLHHVAAMILHARLCRRTRQRKRSAKLAKRAARDVKRVSNCHPSSVWRAQLLRVPWLGINLYELASNRVCALRV